ncbi:MAG TPA: hypothetical protein GXZ90_09205 [Clostridiales bacterium]|nr:hypothetical protein [Clostridiales bacterium]
MAKIQEFDNVRDFLARHWDDGNHIFVRWPEYFKYFQITHGKFNVFVGLGEKTEKIYGICAFVACNSSVTTDIQLNLLRVIDNDNGLSSLTMLDYIIKNYDFRTIAACGIRPKTEIIYQYLDYQTGILNHYYRLNNKDEYQIAVIKNKNILDIRKGKYSLNLIKDVQELQKKFHAVSYQNSIPFKDDQCIRHRYFESMGHKYKVYGINKGKLFYDSIIVMRELDYKGINICKIVDFIGIDEDIGEISTAIQELIDKNNYEFIDFYCIGISHELLEKAGFIMRKSNDENIIPRLFEPFVQENKEIHYFINTKACKFHLYCGDSDQDRVN